MKNFLKVGYLILAIVVLMFTAIPQDVSASMKKDNQGHDKLYEGMNSLDEENLNILNELDQHLTKSENGSVEPFGYDDDIRFCSGTFNSLDGRSYMTMQTNTSSVNRSLQWAFKIRPSAYYLFEPKANVSVSSAFVNGVKINSPYVSHIQIPSYNFHGSMKNYQVSGKNHALKSGDMVKFYFAARNPTSTKGVSVVLLECKVK